MHTITSLQLSPIHRHLIEKPLWDESGRPAFAYIGSISVKSRAGSTVSVNSRAAAAVEELGPLQGGESYGTSCNSGRQRG